MSDYLTTEWFDQSLHARAELFAEATRVGAMIGPATHTTIWMPDTCKPYKCKVEQIADGYKIRVMDDHENVRETFVQDPSTEIRAGNSLVRCRFHASLADGEQHYVAILAENQLKNRFDGAIQRDVPLGTVVGGFDYRKRWSFDETRILTIDLLGLPVRVASDVRALAERLEFQGKVRFNG